MKKYIVLIFFFYSLSNFASEYRLQLNYASYSTRNGLSFGIGADKKIGENYYLGIFTDQETGRPFWRYGLKFTYFFKHDLSKDSWFSQTSILRAKEYGDFETSGYSSDSSNDVRISNQVIPVFGYRWIWSSGFMLSIGSGLAYNFKGQYSIRTPIVMGLAF